MARRSRTPRAGSAKVPEAAKATAWPATAVEMRPLDGLRAYDRNTRRHSPEQIEQIRASMRGFGWTIPLLVG